MTTKEMLELMESEIPLDANADVNSSLLEIIIELVRRIDHLTTRLEKAEQKSTEAVNTIRDLVNCGAIKP